MGLYLGYTGPYKLNTYKLYIGRKNQSHIHDFEFEQIVAATCKEYSYSLFKCSCGKTEKRDFGNVLAEHVFTGNYSWIGVPTSHSHQKLCINCLSPIGEPEEHTPVYGTMEDGWTGWYCEVCKCPGVVAPETPEEPDDCGDGLHIGAGTTWLDPTGCAGHTQFFEYCTICGKQSIDMGPSPHDFSGGICQCGMTEESWALMHDEFGEPTYDDTYHYAASCSQCSKPMGTGSKHTSFTDSKCDECDYVCSHSEKTKTQTVAATCGADGTQWYECNKCNKWLSEKIPATGLHEGGTATCKELAVCTVCKQPYGNYGACDTSGDLGKTDMGHYPTCSVCEQQSGDDEGHNMKTVAEKKATCTEDGYAEHEECEVCGWYDQYNTYKATGHTETPYSIPATCTTDGATGGTKCSVCGTITKDPDVKVPKYGHDTDGDSYVEENVTCTTDGVICRTCSTCGESYTEIIEATGHAWSEWYEEDDGNGGTCYKRDCAKCEAFETRGPDIYV